jgi:hypothetical protein
VRASGMHSKFSKRLVERSGGMEARKVSSPWWQGLTTPALLLGLSSTVLTLLGYGVARSNDAMFGFSYPLWYDTPVDLMAMSGDAFIGWLDCIEKSLGNVSTWQAAGAAGLVVASIAMSLMVWHWFGTSPQARPWRARAVLLRIRLATWFTTPKVKLREQVTHATVTAAAAGVIGGLSALSGLLALLGVIAAICLIPMLGFIGGASYVRAAIIEPASCISPIAMRLRAKSTTVGAPCVETTDSTNGKTVIGRLILARGSRVFVYSKEEDRAYMYTVKDVSLSTVHVLPADARASQARSPGKSRADL